MADTFIYEPDQHCFVRVPVKYARELREAGAIHWVQPVDWGSFGYWQLSSLEPEWDKFIDDAEEQS